MGAQCSESDAGGQYIHTAMDSAMDLLVPHVPANRPFLAEIQNSVDLLKGALMS